MRHTVRRSLRGVEQAGPHPRPPVRVARIARSGAASGAAPGWLVLGTTRTRHKVPERTFNSRA
ncbi:hypothetical protein FPZ41_26985 [Streptomyces sp. K1PN6]|uniref:Uncharacterized protein n=1 Tax=Streptomyces acidicola TaxID=2596892 RepID=A0A5N8WX81_9ACTN|nr:hypothetical protein [Streptomyces acidicola]